MIGCICGRVVAESPASKSPRRPRPVAHVRPLGRIGDFTWPCEQADRTRMADNQVLAELHALQEQILADDRCWEL